MLYSNVGERNDSFSSIIVIDNYCVFYIINCVNYKKSYRTKVKNNRSETNEIKKTTIPQYTMRNLVITAKTTKGSDKIKCLEHLNKYTNCNKMLSLSKG